MLYKDISWFDSKENAPGVLTNILAEDITLLNGLTTETLAIYLQGYLGLIIGMVLSLYFSWRTALISVGCSPFLLIGGILRGRL
mmetsp:Transcript_8749/g.8043  ORF Transcript_8749/g.8043 Transcript_8749/m.8043 type:complete len:84 (+) Transcript_8749:102-353(+)